MANLNDIYGTRANEWVSDEIEHHFQDNQRGTIVLAVPSLTIRPNTYYFHYKFLLGDTDDRNIADAMHLVKPLRVMPYADFYDGMRLKAGRGYEAVVPAKFE